MKSAVGNIVDVSQHGGVGGWSCVFRSFSYDKLSWCEIFLPTLEHVNFPPYKTTEYGMIGQLLSK